MGVLSKNSSDLDVGRRPKLKSDEFLESTPISSRDNRTFLFETAETSGSVIGGATPFGSEERGTARLRDAAVRSTGETGQNDLYA